jgi:hypothetical protein
MNNCPECGAMVAKIKLQDRSETEVHLCPLPYRMDEENGRELITGEGRRVRCRSCFPEEKDGVAYLEHLHGITKR